MKSYFIFCLLFLFSLQTNAQNQDVLGKWKGEWSNHLGYYYKFVLDLREDQFGDIVGEFVWKLIKSPRQDERKKLGLTAIEYVNGSYKRKKLRLKGIRKDDPHRVIGIDVYELTLSENHDILNGITENHGTWKGVFYGSRQIKKTDQLKNKKELKGREIVTTQELKVSSNEVRLQFWDDNKEDGDIISLNLNGEWILKNYVVKKSPGSTQEHYSAC